MSEVELGNIAETKFYVSLKNISQHELKEVPVPGQSWQVTFFKTPQRRGDEIENVLDIHLISTIEDSSDDWARVASCAVKLIRPNDSEKSHQIASGLNVFDAKNKSWEKTKFISWEELLKPENGYIEDDSCRFEIEVKTGPIQKFSSNKWLKFQTIQRCCNDSSYGKFQLTVNNLSESSNVSSPEIQLNKMPWRILVSKGEQLQVLLWNKSEGTLWAPTKITTAITSFNKNIPPVNKEVKISGYHATPLELFSIPWKDVVNTQKRFMEKGSFNIEIGLKMADSEEAKVNHVELECAICFENLFERSVSITHCGHMFCTDCIKRSLSGAPTNGAAPPFGGAAPPFGGATSTFGGATSRPQVQAASPCPNCRQATSISSLRTAYLPFKDNKPAPPTFQVGTSHFVNGFGFTSEPTSFGAPSHTFTPRDTLWTP